MTSQYMHHIFFQGREVKYLDKSVLPVTKKERKGKGNGPSALGCRTLSSEIFTLFVLYRCFNNVLRKSFAKQVYDMKKGAMYMLHVKMLAIIYQR